jgi:hypothetical protein
VLFSLYGRAAARVLGAEQFLTFDQNQRRLAIAEGLCVPL